MILLEDVSLSIPIFTNETRQIKKSLVNSVTGGLLQRKSAEVTNILALKSINCEIKKELMQYILELQDELLHRPLSVYDVCPDVVDTDMTKGLWEDLPKLKAAEVAEAVRFCFESTFNVNKIVIQKNAR